MAMPYNLAFGIEDYGRRRDSEGCRILEGAEIDMETTLAWKSHCNFLARLESGVSGHLGRQDEACATLHLLSTSL